MERTDQLRASRSLGILGLGAGILVGAWWFLRSADTAPATPWERSRPTSADAGSASLPSSEDSSAEISPQRSPEDLALSRSVRGHVRSVEDEVPVVGARVVASRFRPRVGTQELFELVDRHGSRAYQELIDQSLFARGGGLAEDVTDETGAFTLRGIDEARFFVVASSEAGWQLDYPPLELGEGEALTGHEVWLAPGRRLGGRVVDDNRSGIAGARLELFSPLNPTLVLGREAADFCKWLEFTDPEGEFCFPSLPEDRPYTLFVEAPGFAREILRGLSLSGEAGSRTIVLQRGARLFGRVIEETGGAVEGALVVALPMTQVFESILEADRHEFSARTGENGRFEIGSLPSGRYRLYATAPERQTGVRRGVDVASGASLGPVVMTLAAGHWIDGVVVDDQEAPLEGARVRAYRPRIPGVPDLSDMSDDLVIRNETRTAADGTFHFAQLAEGPWNLEVLHPFGRLMHFAETGSSVTITLPRSGAVEGIVVSGKNQEAVPEFRLRLRQGILTVHERRFVDPKGKFRFEGIPAGTYQGLVSARDHAQEPVSDWIIKPGETTRGKVVVLDAGAAISGVVLDALTQEPVAGAWIDADHLPGLDRAGIERDFQRFGLSLDSIPPLPLGGARDLLRFVEEFAAPPRVRSDARGRFEVKGLPRRAVQLTITHPEYRRQQPPAFELQGRDRLEGVTVTLDAGGGLEGVVTDDKGAPVAGVLIIARGGSDHLRQATSTEEGRYQLHGLEPGSWAVLLLDTDIGRDDDNLLAQILSRLQPAVVSVKSGEVTTHDFVISAFDEGGIEVRGTLTYLGAPVERGTLTMIPAGGLQNLISGGARTAAVQADGSYSTVGLKPGPTLARYVNGRSQGRGIDLGLFEIPDQPEAIVHLEIPAGSIRGRLKSHDEAQTMASARLGLADASGHQFRQFFGVQRVSADENGRFEFTMISPGDYRLTLLTAKEVMGQTASFDLASVRLEEGQAIDLGELWVDGGGRLEGAIRDQRGDPIGAAMITAVAKEGARTRRLAMSGPDGLFQLPGLEVGSFSVEVYAQGYALQVQSNVRVAEGAPTTLNVSLRGGLDLGVDVVDGRGNPVEDAETRFRNSRGEERWAEAGVGSFMNLATPDRVARGLGWGRWTVEVMRDDQVILTDEIEVDPDSVRLQLIVPEAAAGSRP